MGTSEGKEHNKGKSCNLYCWDSSLLSVEKGLEHLGFVVLNAKLPHPRTAKRGILSFSGWVLIGTRRCSCTLYFTFYLGLSCVCMCGEAWGEYMLLHVVVSFRLKMYLKLAKEHRFYNIKIKNKYPLRQITLCSEITPISNRFLAQIFHYIRRCSIY